MAEIRSMGYAATASDAYGQKKRHIPVGTGRRIFMTESFAITKKKGKLVLDEWLSMAYHDAIL